VDGVAEAVDSEDLAVGAAEAAVRAAVGK
jgi:hypothetical protein